MTNGIALFGGTGGAVSLAKQKQMAESLKQSAQEGARNQLPDGGVYISFSGKRGIYSIGVDKDDADKDEVWLVNIYDFQRGYICWKGGQPVARMMASIYGTPVSAPDPKEHGPFNSDRGEGWFPAKSIMLRSLDRGIQGLFQTNTKSAVSEFSSLEDKVADRLAEGAPAWPIIQLSKEEFTAQGQKNFKPKLEIYGWIGMKQVMAMSSMEDIDAVAESVDAMIAEAKTGDHKYEEEADAALAADDEVNDTGWVEEAEVEEAEVAEETPPAKEEAKAEGTTRRRAGADDDKGSTRVPPRRRAAV